jgi:hypothetical protein
MTNSDINSPFTAFLLPNADYSKKAVKCQYLSFFSSILLLDVPASLRERGESSGIWSFAVLRAGKLHIPLSFNAP